MLWKLNPWLLLAALCTTLAAFGGGYVKGSADAKSSQVEQELLIQQAALASQMAAAEEIQKIKVKNTTIRQEVRREIETVPVYSDCKHSDVGMRLINGALDGTKPTGDLKLSRQLGESAR